jgi:signal peptidase I
MWTTVLALTVLGIFFLTANVLWGWCLNWGARWVQLPTATPGRALVVTVILAIGQPLAAVALERFQPVDERLAALLAVPTLIVALIVQWLLVAIFYRARLEPAFWAWLPTLVPVICMTFLALFGLRPFVYETYVTAANSMAPTLLGQHWTAACPRCGAPAYGAPRWDEGPAQPVPLDEDFTGQGITMICSRELRSCTVAVSDPTVLRADRFLVSKLLKPRRWDVIVFRRPEHPSAKYVKRLVGLPGEVLLIRDGVVWIDGQKCVPPESLRGIAYVAELDGVPGVVWGSPEHPVKLRPDEYFVLDDFSMQADDSRLRQPGAPQPRTFVVPASYVEGVVTHIYWPPHRWRILR